MSYKKYLAINYLYNFIYDAFDVMLPIYLAYNGVALADMGMLLAIFPLVFLVARLFFSMVADVHSTKPFYILTGVSNIAAVLSYSVFSPLAFIIGKVLNGITSSAFWAVNRSSLSNISPRGDGETHVAINLASMRLLGAGTGRLTIGFVLAYFSFSGGFVFLGAVTICLTLIALGVPMGKPVAKPTFAIIKPLSFWLSSLALAIFAGMRMMLIVFLYPLYMDSQHYSFEQIGLSLAGYLIVSTIGSRLYSRFGPKPFVLVLMSLGMASPMLLWFAPGMGLMWFILLLLVNCLGFGAGIALFEEVLFKEVAGSKALSFDIGYIHVPARFAEMALLILTGYCAQYYGYGAAFAIAGIIGAIYPLLSWAIIKQKRQGACATLN